MKRLVDIFGAALGLTILAPVFAVIAIAVKLDSSGPVFRTQRRLGMRGRIFTSYKFRSEHQSGYSTRVGWLLRTSTFELLPMLFNVLKGDMSLVGPAPLGPELAADYGGAAFRLATKPGLSGAWEVSRRQVNVFRRPPNTEGGAHIIDWGKALHLLGATIRDIGILVVVFAPLDAYFRPERPRTSVMVLIEVGGLLFVTIGIIVESLVVESRG